MDRSWCLSTLARRGDLEGTDLERALGHAPVTGGEATGEGIGGRVNRRRDDAKEVSSVNQSSDVPWRERLLILRTGLVLILSTAALAAHATDDFLLVDGHSGLTREPCVAVDDQGDTVFAWASEVPGGLSPSIASVCGDSIRMAKRSRRSSVSTPSREISPGIRTFLSSRAAAVSWSSGKADPRARNSDAGSGLGSSTATGKPVGTEIRVDQIRLRHDYWGLPREYFGGPAVSVAPSGDFVVVWRSDGRTSCDRFNISARRFSASGEPLADEVIVNRDRRVVADQSRRRPRRGGELRYRLAGRSLDRDGFGGLGGPRTSLRQGRRRSGLRVQPESGGSVGRRRAGSGGDTGRLVLLCLGGSFTGVPSTDAPCREAIIRKAGRSRRPSSSSPGPSNPPTLRSL